MFADDVSMIIESNSLSFGFRCDLKNIDCILSFQVLLVNVLVVAMVAAVCF